MELVRMINHDVIAAHHLLLFYKINLLMASPAMLYVVLNYQIISLRYGSVK